MWNPSEGERLVQKELRKTLLKYQLHREQDLFNRAFAYIRQYGDHTILRRRISQALVGCGGLLAVLGRTVDDIHASVS